MAQISMKTARSSAADPETVADELLEQLGSAAPKLVTLFANRNRDQQALNAAVRKRLGKDTRLLGATSAREIDSDGMHDGTVVLGALEGDFEVGIGLGKSVSKDALGAGASAMRDACEQLGSRAQDLDPSRHVGVVIDDGYRYKKEELLMGALSKNQGLILVGGGASSPEQDPEKQSSELHVDGDVATDSFLVAMIRTEAPFAALRHHAYTPTGQTLTITKVSDDGNCALEIDGKPAAQRYADLLGVGTDELEFGMPKGFAQKPLALKVGREYFLRSPWKPLPDGSILFANLLEEDSTYELMELGDMAAMTADFMANVIPKKVENPTAALHFHCSGRQWLADGTDTRGPLSDAFTKGPTCAGLNVFFEMYCGFHINTTLTSLVFGSK